MDINDWKIDNSAGRPILTYKGCSVIEDKDAEFVLGAVRAALTAAEPMHIEFGEGKQVVGTVTIDNYPDRHFVAINPAVKPGTVGEKTHERENRETIIGDEVLMSFPTFEQASRVMDAICNVAVDADLTVSSVTVKDILAELDNVLVNDEQDRETLAKIRTMVSALSAQVQDVTVKTLEWHEINTHGGYKISAKSHGMEWRLDPHSRTLESDKEKAQREFELHIRSALT